MLICNDRRWPEAWRCVGLAGAGLVLVGYNTPRHYPEHPEADRFQATWGIIRDAVRADLRAPVYNSPEPATA